LEEKNKHDEMFKHLVLQFHSAALIQLGLVKNPQTDKLEKNLNQAHYFIDMLAMLQKKTAGNLSKEDSDILTQSVTNLKMSYVQQRKSAPSEPEEEKEKEKQESVDSGSRGKAKSKKQKR
jgi:hypothetical protein